MNDQQLLYMPYEQNDKESVSSKGSEPESPWVSFKRFFCPCLLPRKSSLSKSPKRVVDNSSTDSKGDKQTNEKQQIADYRENLELHKTSSRQRRISEEDSRRQALLETDPGRGNRSSYRQTMHIQLSYNNRMRSMQEINWPICQYTENYLITIGDTCNQVLAKVTPVTISTDPDKFKKQIIKKSSKRQKNTSKYNEFDLFWNQRYEYFERFDEGIKIKEEMLSKIPYESLSQYISRKCNGAKTILDGFAGVGSLTIKMACINSCAKVIANEIDKEKLSFLLNNATVYEVDCFLELSNRDFLKIDRKNIDVVVVHPPLQEHQNVIKMLDEIICKSMSLAPNFIMLLPPDINIEALSSSICKYARKFKWMKDFCSIKLEKVYNKHQLKYILVCAGKLVQGQIKLNDQLEYMYGKLKKIGEKFFKHKKIIKKIREDHGMLELLSIVRQSEKIKNQAFLKNPVANQQLMAIDCFYDLILKKKLISPQKLNKIKLQQEESLEKAESLLFSGALEELPGFQTSPVMEEEKLEDNPIPIREAELTTSEYSYLSFLESLGGKKSRISSAKSSLNSQLASGESGVIIKRSNIKEKILGVDSVEQDSSDLENTISHHHEGSNKVSVSSKSRNSELTDKKREDEEGYRKKTTFHEK